MKENKEALKNQEAQADLAKQQAEGAAEDEMEEQVVVITDEDGCESYYREELILPVDNKNFAVLVGFDPEEAGDEADEAEEADEEAEDAAKTETCSCGCHHHHDEGEAEDDDEDDNIIIARIDTDENGEEVYVGPTDEEFVKVRAAYEALFKEEE
jgi:uncharacterized protein YrzB (UPF0473 family)